ncbi:NADP(H)-dependent aldo-keto reductase [Magnetovibrio sp.]|uniref:NADP(H)-dependent aldo-keto reductase n=1 Tax=Magnetovibrio sp. TaxID=2024836 RepID=UPI002F924B55
MIYNELGRTGMQVSRICLGTMTWGRQNSQEQAFEQMDYARDQGVNFFDTAELYATPPSAETYGATETIIGNWFKARGGRDKVILASKVACKNVNGQNPPVDYMREGDMKLDRANITAAVDASLKRLQTDYIDLYQVHWPERRTNFFGRLGYEHDEHDPSTPIEETLDALAEIVKAGKVRAIGLSNETPWGVMKYLALAEQKGLPRIASVQNPYSLLNRTYEIGTAEVSAREDCGLLAYSPMAFGVLSGKYLGGARPEGARLTLFPYFDRYVRGLTEQATAQYVQLARDYDLDPGQMALAFVNRQPFLTANIIGATTMEQLKSNIASLELALSAEVLEGIEAIHHDTPNPSP